MLKSERWIKIAGLVVLIVAIFIAFSHEYLLKKIGLFLVYAQSPQKADVIVVLNGRDCERSLAAVDLYNNGYSKLIVMAEIMKQPGTDEFRKRVKKNINRKMFFQWAIESMGVPEDSFKLIGDGISSTYDEALVIKQFMLDSHYQSILLVTSKWHSKRAYLTFQSVFKRDDNQDLRILVYPSKYDTFNPDAWWKQSDGAELIFYEYVRLIYYVMTLRISPFVLFE
jgi:uncharacterized SAM-binding protein YcdF (DUF218 family)